MYRQLQWMRDCGFFDDYQWDAALPDFERINVIYGPNGTGKTSLAGALDGLRHPKEQAGYTRVAAVVETPARRATGGYDDPIFDRTLVFSEDFVSRSHNFASGSADMPAVLTIGQRTTEAERDLELLRKDRDDKLSALKVHRESETAALAQVDRDYGNVSQQVVDAASRAEGRWRSRGHFSARVVRIAFEGSHDSWASLSVEELQSKIGLVNSDMAEPIQADQLAVAPAADLRDRLVEALSTTPATIVLESLAKHPEATSWVSDGRALHKECDECIFCGSMLTDERRSEIDAHFSDEVTALERELAKLIEELTSLVKEVDQAESSLPAKGLFFEDLRVRHATADATAKTELKDLRNWATKLQGRANAKIRNVISPSDSSVDEAPAVTAREMLSLRREHNDRVDQHDQQVQSAAKAIESHYLKVAEAGVAKNAKTASDEAAAADRLERDLVDLNTNIKAMEATDGDPQPSARVLTEEVARLLGRRELEFATVGQRYHVTRRGVPAEGLSMGERTAITLVHFLEMVACFDASAGKPVVVIDDPVSSLDSDIFMGVSTYIWTEAVAKDHIGQIFLLTHNFELFRQWDIQIEALHNGPKVNGQRMCDVYSAAFYEIRPKVVTRGADTRRRPFLAAWPPSSRARKMVRSTYHHAFMAVADAKLDLLEEDNLERRLSAQLLFPNVIRRMLETFLAFKHPQWVGNLNSAMRKSADLLRAADYPGDPDALRLRLTRYAHAYSHSETPVTDIVVSPDEVGSAISAVFEFMNCLDHEHFAGLCEAVGLDPSELLPSGRSESAGVTAVGGSSSG